VKYVVCACVQECPIDFFQSKTDAAVAKQTLHNLTTVVSYLVGASAAIVHLHANHIVHGDIAARNCLVDANHNCAVCDFGMSHRLSDGQSYAQTDAAKIPIAWASPETLEKRIWSEKTDVYAFGVTMVEVMSRNNPYPGVDLKVLKPRVCNAQDPFRPTIDGWWPLELAEIAMDCMMHRAAERPSMAVVNQRLHRYHKKLSNALQLSRVYFPHADTELSAQPVPIYEPQPASAYYLNC